jgi:hypothetical protein
MSSWSNVPGEFGLELDIDEDGDLFDCGTEVGCGNADLEFLKPHVEFLFPSGPSVEVFINFTSTGSHQYASMYGGCDNLGWPEEFEEERSFESAEIFVDGKRVATLPQNVGLKLFDLFEERIQKVELESERCE